MKSTLHSLVSIACAVFLSLPFLSAATVNAANASAAVTFEYGPTTSYGTVVTATPATVTGTPIQTSMQGGWAGDMYAYVTHASGFAVLLNRLGRSLANYAGSGVSEFTVEFGDSAPTGIHTSIASSGSFSRFFQPDAREIDPSDSLDTSPRTAFLSSFDGLDANGEWTLFVADVATGDQMTLNGWTLTVAGVPEPATTILAVIGMMSLLRRRRS